MHCPTPTNADCTTIARLRAPTLSTVDWRPIRGSLGALQAGYEEIEQFVSQLLDEVDAAWQEFDAERTLVSESRGMATVAASAAAATLLPAVTASNLLQHDDLIVRRIAELEEDRCSLLAEVEIARDQLAEQAKQVADERRAAADERAIWANELRHLREAIHQQMAAFNAVQAGGATIRNGNGSSATGTDGHAGHDPVLGPLLTQFKILQRDVARRRELSEKTPD